MRRYSSVAFAYNSPGRESEITNKIIPYFQAVNDNISKYGRTYRVGIYGPRSVCKRVSAAGLAVYSFVSDMSTGYSGNIGQTLPSNWAFDQIQTLNVGGPGGQVEVDKVIVSGRDAGVSSLAAETNVGHDPLIPSAKLEAFKVAWLNHCYDHGDYSGADQIMKGNANAVGEWVRDWDSHITALAKKYKTYKAFVLTPLIWEGLAIHGGDAIADQLVRNYYTEVEYDATRRAEPTRVEEQDSWTGPCRIFARTAILSRNWARENGLISDREYKFSQWRDRWAVWQRLSTDFSYSIETAPFVMMYDANARNGIGPAEMRNMTPAQVMNTPNGYNDGQKYGRERMQLYYLIQRWHQDFRS